jgi:hypothetical protein
MERMLRGTPKISNRSGPVRKATVATPIRPAATISRTVPKWF